jgi:hypothetical protein
MREKRAGYESTGEWYWPVIERPKDPSLKQQLEDKAAEYGRRIGDNEPEGESIWRILQQEYYRDPHAEYFPKTDAFLKLLIVDQLLVDGSVDTAELYRGVRDNSELQNIVLTMHLYNPHRLDVMLQSAAVIIDQYANGEQKIINRSTP